MPPTSADPRKRRRQQQEAFSQALRDHKPLRVAWLAALRSFLAHTADNIVVAPEDEVEFREIDKRLPQDGESRLNIVEVYLREKVAEFVKLFAPTQLVGLFLVGTVARCMHAKDLNPLSPWERRGRPRQSGFFQSEEELRQRAGQQIARLRHLGLRPAQHRVAELLGVDQRTLRNACHEFGILWSDLVRNACQRG